MWIDTHAHFDMPVFGRTRQNDWKKANTLGVKKQIIMAVNPFNFTDIIKLSKLFTGTGFALGTHPMFCANLDLQKNKRQLEASVLKNINNPRFLGIGEVGLDGTIDLPMPVQVEFLKIQLEIASKYNLPVFLHIRKAQDLILKYCKIYNIEKGIAHAFNGSHQQTEKFINQGLKLGMGGALTFPNSNQIHRIIKDFDISSFVLETDSPDMLPYWCKDKENHSFNLPKIAADFAQIKNIGINDLKEIVMQNSYDAVPKLLTL